jgi:hypothetical protein
VRRMMGRIHGPCSEWPGPARSGQRAVRLDGAQTLRAR